MTHPISPVMPSAPSVFVFNGVAVVCVYAWSTVHHNHQAKDRFELIITVNPHGTKQMLTTSVVYPDMESMKRDVAGFAAAISAWEACRDRKDIIKTRMIHHSAKEADEEDNHIYN